MITQNQYNVLRQPTRHLNIKIDLINENDIIVESFEGIAVDGQISLSGDSAYRRSGNLTMVFDKKYNLLPSPSSKIWFNKKLGLSIGLKNYFDEIVWFNMGRFAIDEVELNFNSAEKTLSCQLKDYMSLIDGTLAGNLSHKIIIDEGTPITEAIRQSLIGLGQMSIENIQINNMSLIMPYTIEKSIGSTVYDIVKELVELYMSWDFFVDESGVYVVEKIRDKVNDSIIEAFDGSDKDFSLNATTSIDFKNVKNSIYIWGRQLIDGTQVKWVYRNRWVRQNHSDLDNLIDKQKGDICHILNENNSYVYNDGWKLLDFKVQPSFCIEKIGEKVWSENFDNIFNETQAKMRAEYELEQRSNMAETVNFSCVPLYYLKPNKKIYMNIDDLIQGDYLVTSVSMPLNISATMNVQAKKLYY